MSIDSAQFRQVLGHFPTGVTVITATNPAHSPHAGPVGFTIGSFVSVSLDPPLVGFLPMVTSDRWHAIEAAGTFCVNVLGADQGDLCWRFAKSSIDQPFEGVSYRPSPETGSPLLDGVIAWIDCEISEIVDAGDHKFVMGRVLALGAAEADTDPNPLLFFKGSVGGFQRNG
ncbi:MAG: flavin reductase family protein [Ilumatobacteraceae bacterium]